MKDLITIVENEPRVSHRVVAQNTENQQKNINELIHKYRDDIKEFGTLPFKTEGVVNGGKGEQPKTYYLNEPQATFLMTLLRNKPIVVEFKKKLVKAFYQQREALKTNSFNSENGLIDVIMVFANNQQKQTDAILELIDTQQAQNNVIMDFAGMVTNFITKYEKIPEIPKCPPSPYLDSRDRKKLRDAIQEKAKEVAGDLGVSVSTITSAIWIELKSFFDVDDYQDIHKDQLKDVMHFVMFWEPKKRYKKEQDVKITAVLS